MKKAVYFTFGLILLSLFTDARSFDEGTTPSGSLSTLNSKAPNSGAKCFDGNSRLLNIGLGFGYTYYTYPSGSGVSTRNLPTISVSYEQPWKERLGPGFLGVGGYLAMKNSSYKADYTDFYGSYTVKESNNNFIIASRAMYHWDELNFEKAEVYGGFILGIRVAMSNSSGQYSGGYSTVYGTSNYDNSDVSIGLAASFVAGARYYFKPKFAVYGELSYGISWLTVGLTVKI
jgi:hypothetical protein